MSRMRIGFWDLAMVFALALIVLFELGVFTDRTPPAGPRQPTGAVAVQPTAQAPAPPRYDYPFADLGTPQAWARFDRGIVTGGPRRPGLSTGTGFLVAGSAQEGTWLTARHVTEGCHRLTLWGSTRRQDARVSFVDPHPAYDAAAFWTDAVGDPLVLTDSALAPGTPAAGVGFPQGTAGIVELRYRGPAGYRRRAPDFRLPERWHDVWQVSRYPAHVGLGGEIGGISGGPLVLGDGRVAGIVIAGAPRRREVVTVPVEIVRNGADRVQTATVGEGIDAAALFQQLLGSGRVRQLLCEIV